MDVAGLRHYMGVLESVVNGNDLPEFTAHGFCHDCGFFFCVADGAGKHFHLARTFILKGVANVNLCRRNEFAYSFYDVVYKYVVDRKVNFYALLKHESVFNLSDILAVVIIFILEMVLDIEIDGFGKITGLFVVLKNLNHPTRVFFGFSIGLVVAFKPLLYCYLESCDIGDYMNRAFALYGDC